MSKPTTSSARVVTSLLGLCLLALVAVGCRARIAPRKEAEPRDPDLFLRVGPKGGAAFYEQGVQFEGKTLRRTFRHGGTRYTFVIRERPAGSHSIRKTKWDIILYRGEERQENELDRGIIGNPREDGGGGCQNLTDYARTGGLWIEIGFKGKSVPAKTICAALRKN